MTAPKPDPQIPGTLKVPLAIIGPIWGLIALLISMTILYGKNNADIQARMSGMQRDFSHMVRTTSRIESKVDGTYPRAEAERELGILRGRLDDHEDRIRKVERP